MPGQVSQDVVEALIEYAAPSPTTPTGAGVSQDVVEALIAAPDTVVVSQDVVEALIRGTNDAALVSQAAVEALIAYAAPSPTTPTGVGVSQAAVEALIAYAAAVDISQDVVEALIAGTFTAPPEPPSGVERIQIVWVG